MNSTLSVKTTVDNMNDKLSLKNLLFTRAIPHYNIPVDVTGHKVFSCTDCGDKFVFESSYEYHINRKSVLITYVCRHCGEQKKFYNRCNLLSHIRSHSFKTATINITDLTMEPLPLRHFNLTLKRLPKNSHNTYLAEIAPKPLPCNICHECKKDITVEGSAYRDRKRHFMQFTNEVYTCPVCLFALPTECGLKAHVRLHLKFLPYFCPECGIQLPNRNVQYPYNHDCEGFKMMRVTARLKCPINSKCNIFHPNDFTEHMKNNHINIVYKCQQCVVAGFNEAAMVKHLKKHHRNARALLFYQCEMCPGRLISQNHMDQHLKSHVNINIYPCWTCGTLCKNARDLLCHHMKKHIDIDFKTHKLISSVINNCKIDVGSQRIYRVVKRCDQCKRSFIYKCAYCEISTLPIVCPYKCSTRLQSQIEVDESTHAKSQLICYMCKNEMSEDWEDIKKHFAIYHKKYRCLDIKIQLTRLNIGKRAKGNKIQKDKWIVKSPKQIYKDPINPQNKSNLEIPDIVHRNSSGVNGDQSCSKCGEIFGSRILLEQHMISHRDPCMAYQCMECGESFIVKPSFSMHLMLKHKITDVEKYITTKQCYNENTEFNEPIRKNQCTICREQFENSEDLEKHFRVHGMAFLKKNTTNKANT